MIVALPDALVAKRTRHDATPDEWHALANSIHSRGLINGSPRQITWKAWRVRFYLAHAARAHLRDGEFFLSRQAWAYHREVDRLREASLAVAAW